MKMHYTTISKIEKLLSENFKNSFTIYETYKEMKDSRFGEFVGYFFDKQFQNIERQVTGIYDYTLECIKELKLYY